MKNRHLLTVLTAMLLAVGIFLYNYWSYSCGRCTLGSFFMLSPPAVILLFCNVAAFLLLYRVKSRNRRRLNGRYCICGNPLQHNWQFCPDCGSAYRNPARS